MGLFDSVAGTFFNAATAAYKTVVAPVQTAVQTITRPVVQGSYQTGATEQVAVQPRPPIVTSVANQNTYQAQQAMVGPQATYTPQTTPSGQQVYVSSRASPVQPKPIEVTRPVQVQAPSIAESIGMLAPGAGIVGAAQFISGDRKVVQNAIMDIPGTGTFVTGAPTLAGYRETNIKQQETIAQARIEQQKRQVEQIKLNNAAQTLRTEQAIRGYNQREQALRREVSEFNALGPATSIEEYNTRLNTSNLLNTKIQGLQTEGSKINADILAGKQNLYKQQIGLLNENDAINRDLVNLNVASANLGTTGIAGLSAGWEARVDKPLAEVTMGAVGSPFGLSSAEVRQGLALNRMVGEARVNAGDYSPSALSHAFGSGMLEDTLTKPGTALAWTGIGVATGGVTRALAPGMEAAVAASRVPGAALGTRALGTGIRAAPYVMGGMFAGQVGFETGFESTPTGLKMRSPGGMVSRLGGLTATEILPMVGGGVVGYKFPEIYGASSRAIRGFKPRETIQELRSIPVFRQTRGGELQEIAAELRSIPTREPTFPKSTAIERPVGGKQPRIERISDSTIQDEFLQLNYEPFEKVGKRMEPAVGLTREQLLPVKVEPQLSFVDLTKPTRSIPVVSQRLTPVYEVVAGKPGKYAFRGYQGKTNPLEGDPLGIIYENIVSDKILTYNPKIKAFEPTVTGRAWYKSITEWGLPKAEIFSPPAVESLAPIKVFGPQKPAKAPLGKQIETFLGRPSEQLKSYDSYSGWKGGMQSALGGTGRMEMKGGGLTPVLEIKPTSPVRTTQEYVKFYPRVDTSGVVGIGISAASLSRAGAIGLGASGIGLYGFAEKQMGALVGETGPDAYQRFLLQIDYEKFYGVGTYPTGLEAFGAAADNRRYTGGLPTIGINIVQSPEYRDIQDFTRINIDTSQRRQGPINMGVRGLLPVDIVGETNIPETAFRVTPIQLTRPDLLITPDVRIVQTPKPDLTTRLITDQILITTPEIPPYTPPEFTFEVPPIPPIIIPGFPMGDGGGGGGGYGGDRGGYIFEETLKGGGESDPFGIGGMNFDAMGIAGIPKSSRRGGRRRRRK
jgi:hypothetical protein